MPKLAANLSMLFTEEAFMDRFDAAAKAGFKGVEFLFPYAFDLEQIAERLESNGLEMVLHNLPAGNWEAGERGIACHPDRVGEFLQSLIERLRAEHAELLDRINESGVVSDEDEQELGKAIGEMVDDFGPDFDAEGNELEEGESDRIRDESEREAPAKA